MDLKLNQQHVLITGGSKGIGLACALAFLQEGCRLSLVARSVPGLQQAQAWLRSQVSNAQVRVYAADLRDAQQATQVLQDAIAAEGAVDVLVNSAGAAKRTPPQELHPGAWHDAMDAKYFSYIHVLDPVVQQMAKRGQGVIVNIIGAGGKVAAPVHLPGGAANAALMLVSVGLAHAFGPHGVRVVAINPGATLTDRLDEGLQAQARMDNTTPEALKATLSARIPLGRMADPQDIAHAAVFLASSKASYISGVVLTMDGVMHPMVV